MPVGEETCGVARIVGKNFCNWQDFCRQRFKSRSSLLPSNQATDSIYLSKHMRAECLQTGTTLFEGRFCPGRLSLTCACDDLPQTCHVCEGDLANQTTSCRISRGKHTRP